MWLSQPNPLEVLQDVLAHLNPLDVLEVHLVLISLAAPPIIPPVRFSLVHCSIYKPFCAPGTPHSEPGDLGDTMGGVELPDPLIQSFNICSSIPVLMGVLTIVGIPDQLGNWKDGGNSKRVG